MTYLTILLVLALGFVVCWALIPLIQRLSSSRRNEFHHTHQRPVSRFGGVALATAFAAIATAAFVAAPQGVTTWDTRLLIIISCLAMFGLGLWDDLKPIGAKKKLLGQILIASIVYAGGIQIALVKNPFTNSDLILGGLGFFATVAWLVMLTNLINIIDGIDGLAGGISLMLMCLLATVGMGSQSGFSMLLAVGMAGALLGFLSYNKPPARIYMGDGGAYFLGFLIGILSIVNSHKGSVTAALIAPLFALALPIVDVTLAVLRRGLKGLPLFRADRKHIHHRLIDYGFSRGRTVLILYVISFLCLFLAFGAFWSQGRSLPLLLGFLFLVLSIAAHSFGFLKDWLALASPAGRSLRFRKETRYALTLSQWLEMEAERRSCVFELWQDYQFVVRKLGFSEVKLALPDGTNLWRAVGPETGLSALHRTRHDLGPNASVEFAAYEGVLPQALFELLAELAAEAWQKSALRWQEFHQASVQFDSVTSDTSHFRKNVRLYEAVRPAWWLPKSGLRPEST
ncbi:MAG: UDP-GlcNAc:undecaprenyl-phosphate/decaprenyl-phosphate GlcNAc-phosphate transferase [Verrucomicrobiota bacterium]|jgi:UDP-GlcNAc:undecaprenyl-phosphate GlcNAc-1-phosphate transferase